MKVCFIYSNRAEYSILSSYIQYFKKNTSTVEINLAKKIKHIDLDENLSEIYSYCLKNFIQKKYDYICILGDRKEMSFVALAILLTGNKLVHIAAGETLKGTPTYDLYIRPAISLISKYQICFSENAKKEIVKLFKGISYLKPKAFVFGNPVFYGINEKQLKRTIKESYDLVLIHPQSLSKKQTKIDLIKLENKIKNRKTLFLQGNKDRNYELIEEFYRKIKTNKNYVFLDSLPKKKYFSLVKYCNNFYTNSSSMSEIKFLNKKCLIQIGLRNKCRVQNKLDKRSPEKLYNLLKKDFVSKKHQNQT